MCKGPLEWDRFVTKERTLEAIAVKWVVAMIDSALPISESDARHGLKGRDVMA